MVRPVLSRDRRRRKTVVPHLRDARRGRRTEPSPPPRPEKWPTNGQDIWRGLIPDEEARLKSLSNSVYWSSTTVEVRGPCPPSYITASDKPVIVRTKVELRTTSLLRNQILSHNPTLQKVAKTVSEIAGQGSSWDHVTIWWSNGHQRTIQADAGRTAILVISGTATASSSSAGEGPSIPILRPGDLIRSPTPTTCSNGQEDMTIRPSGQDTAWMELRRNEDLTTKRCRRFEEGDCTYDPCSFSHEGQDQY